MARIDKGLDLSTPKQQPGAKFSDDGYGVLTATVVYKADKTNDLSIAGRGSTCPVGPPGILNAHKFGVVYDALGYATITVDYIGLDPLLNGGLYSNPQVGAANGLTTENITTNPNFFTAGGDGYAGLIAGVSYVQSELGPMVEIKSPADYVTEVILGKTIIVSKKQSYVGNNGACFESENGGRFIGFVDPSDKHFYGKSNYLAPTSSFSGHFFTSEDAEVQNITSYLGTTSRDNDWAGVLPNIVPDYAGTSWASSAQNGDFNQLLLSQVSVEDYGLLYKVNYEVRYSVQGWHDSVYRDARLM